MAILGFLVHTLKEHVHEVESRIQAMPEMTTYGVYQDQYIVVVADAPSERIDGLVESIKDIDGVLTTYATYLTVEDEMDEDGNLKTNLTPAKIFGKKSKLDMPS